LGIDFQDRGAMSGIQKEQAMGRRRVAAVLVALGLVALGQVRVLGGHWFTGAVLTLLAGLTVLAEARMPKEKTPALAPASGPGRRRSAPVVSAGAGSGGGARSTGSKSAPRPQRASTPRLTRDTWKRWVTAFNRWTPLQIDELRLQRYWLLAPLLPLGVLMQVGWAGGKTVLPALCLGCMGIIVAVFLQNREHPLVLPNLNANVRALVAAGLGLPLQLLGAWTMWLYRFEMSGFALEILGGAWSLWALSQWPLRLATPEDGALKGDEWLVASPRPFYTWKLWQTKFWFIGGAVICAYASMVIFAADNQSLSVALGFLAIALLLASFPWLPGPLASTLPLPANWQPAVTLALAVVAVLVGYRGQALMDQGATTLGLWYFLSAGVAAVLASAPRHLSGRAPAPEAEPPRWMELGLVLSLLAMAWMVHVWKIDIFPYAAEGDEAGGGVWGWDVLHHNLENPLISSNVPLQFYSITAFFYRCFGLSVATMRLHSVVFGTLSVASAYFFMRLFSGWAAALLGSLLMLFSYWHLHFSRFGHYNIEQVYAEMAAFYFVFKGLRDGRFWLFVAGGAAFGLAMQPHLASRLLPFEGLAFVVYLVMAMRPNLRRHATGLLAFVLAAWVISSPSLMYWFRATGISFGRASSVSIFDKTNSNAPPDVLAGFVVNSKASMLMFNQAGDSRSRDNPLAPEKILETGMAVLFALAFAYALYHWREPGRFFLLAVFFINLSASVFSVEAPQTLRTAGNIPVVFAIIALWLGDVSAGLVAWGRRRALWVFLGVFLPLTLGLCYHSAYKYFIEKSDLRFDVSPTYVGIAVGQAHSESPTVQAMLAASGYAVSHPPVILFKQGADMQNYYNLAEFLPPVEAEKRDLMVILSDDYQQTLPYVQSLFPTVQPQVIHNTSRVGGPDIATYLRVPAAVVAQHQGLRARALVGGRWVEVSNTSLDNAGPAFAGASRIVWQGALLEKHYARCSFLPVGGGRTTLRLDGAPLPAGRDTVLAVGVHSLQVEWMAPPKPTAFHMEWTGQPINAGLVFNLSSAWHEAVPKSVLWQDIQPRGFYGHYYASPDCKGDPVAETVEPVLFAHWLDSPILGTWSGRWKARFQVPKPGRYHFRAQVMAFGEVRVNGILVARMGTPLVPELKAPKILDGVDLKAGWNTVEMRMATGGAPWMELRWSGPDLPDQLMQPASLEPLKD
jgi:hypothetical protein